MRYELQEFKSLKAKTKTSMMTALSVEHNKTTRK